MKIDFLNNSCKESARTDLQFGLCDDQNGSKAYSDHQTSEKWIATIENKESESIVFTPIDKALIKDDELPGIGRCDGLLTTDSHLIFVELKNQRGGWISDAAKQLEDTIKLFRQNHDIAFFKHRKAYACNKAHPHFHEIDNETNIRFFRKYKVRLDLQAKIIVIK